MDIEKQKHKKILLFISHFVSLILIVTVKYFLFWFGGWEQIIAIPLFSISAVYLLNNRIELLRIKYLTNASYKMAFISDILFFSTVLFFPAFGDHVFGIWPGWSIYDYITTDIMLLILYFAFLVLLIISIALSKMARSRAL